MLIHPVKPIYDNKSEILILGTFPSVKSREEKFFYAHAQNRFWKVMAKICCCDLPKNVDEKTRMILDNHFALWDVIHSCEVTDSADSTIKNVVPNDISIIINHSNIKKIFVNGKKADSLYKKYIEKDIGIEAICLPSTSPANARWSEEDLYQYWNEKIKQE